MKKYWNKLIFAVVALCTVGAVACSDDASELPDYYFENFAYLQLFPDTNTAAELSATNDMRGVTVTGTFTDFSVKLREAVTTDTKIVLAPATTVASGYTAVPESAVSFKQLDAETGEPVENNDIVIAAGATSVKVRATLLDTSFAESSRAAEKYMLSVNIASLSGSNGLKISSNKNEIKYGIQVASYEYNYVSLASASGGSEAAIVAQKSATNTPELPTTEFPDLQVKLKFAIDRDVKVKLAANESLVSSAFQLLSADNLTFKVNDAALTGNTVTIPAGETSVIVKVAVKDASFVSTITDLTAFACPLVIQEVTGHEEVTANPEAFRFDYKIYVPDFLDFSTSAPTEGTLQKENDYKYYCLSKGSLYDGSKLKDGSEDTYFYSGLLYAVIIDFGETKDITGFQSYAFYRIAGYAPSSVDIYISDNGEDWVLARTSTIPAAGSQTVGFAKPLHARYIKYDSTASTYMVVAFTEFYPYVK